MANVSSSCEWCGKSISFDSEKKDQKGWWKCDVCNAKVSNVEINDCYEEVKALLDIGKWVVGKRIIQTYGSDYEEYVIFTFLSTKGYVRASHSRTSIKDALDDLTSTVWNKEDISKFGFTFLQEFKPITTNIYPLVETNSKE